MKSSTTCLFLPRQARSQLATRYVALSVALAPCSGLSPKATAKKIEYAQLAGHYKRMGSASYRSDSPRFGSSLELAMRGATQAENPSLGAANPNIPGIGHYRDVERDARGTYWATSKKTESLWNLPADHDFGY